MQIFKGKKVTHKNKFYENGIKFHKKEDGKFLYFSETYNKWMPSVFNANLVAL